MAVISHLWLLISWSMVSLNWDVHCWCCNEHIDFVVIIFLLLLSFLWGGDILHAHHWKNRRVSLGDSEPSEVSLADWWPGEGAIQLLRPPQHPNLTVGFHLVRVWWHWRSRSTLKTVRGGFKSSPCFNKKVLWSYPRCDLLKSLASVI
jgi:hypothetical protein